MPGPLDAEFAASLLRQGMHPGTVLDAARQAEASHSSLLGWLAGQHRLAPAELDRVIAGVPPVACPACGQALPLADLWPRADAACPRCRASLPREGVAPRIGAVCNGQPDPGPSEIGVTLAAPSGGLPAGVGLAIGQTFQGFELLQELGRGGMGVVFRARQHTPRREVALKVLLTRGTPEAQRARFRREIDALASLGGEPGIVTIYEAGEERGLLFFAMELVQGGSLSDLIHAGPVEVTRALQLGAETARALHVAHEAGIVHRDVKPADILLTRSGRPKVGAFGLVLPADEERITRSGDVVGTPRYLAPEQLESPEVDRRCDVYALGVVLYELLSGQEVFPTSEGLPGLYGAILTKTPQALDAVAPVPEAVAAVVARALAKDPRERPQTALALAEELERCRVELQAAPPVQRSRLVPTLAVATLVAAAGLAIAIAQRSGPHPGAPTTASPAPAASDPTPTPTPTTPTAPTPKPTTPTPTERPMTAQEQRVARLLNATGALRGADPRGSERLGVLIRAGQGELDLLLAQAPTLRAHPAARLLEAWLGRFTRRDGGYDAATAALRGAGRGPLRSLALEAHVVCSDPKLRDRHRVIVEDAAALLTESPGFVPHPMFFGAANDAGSGYFGVLGVTSFLRPSGLLPPKLKEPVRAERYLGLLVAANRRNHFNNRPYSYARLAAVQLGRGDHEAVARTLESMVSRHPKFFFGYLLRGGYSLHRGDRERAKRDLGLCRAWFRRYPQLLPEMQSYLTKLEKKLAEGN